MNDLSIYKELVPLADRFSKSSLVPAGFKKPEDALYAIALGHELGLSPIYSLNNIAVINGKPSLSADCKLAICKSSPEFAGVEISDSSTSCTVTLKRKYANGTQESRTVKFTIDDAKKAGLMRNPVWEKYPARMLRARALGYACTDVFGDLLAGIYTPEEVEEFTSKPEQRTKPVTPEYEVVDTKPVVDKVELALALKEARETLYSVPMVSTEMNTWKESIDTMFKAGDIAGIRNAQDALRERLEAAQSTKKAEVEGSRPSPEESTEMKAKSAILKVLRELIAKGRSAVYVRNSLKKHLNIVAEKDDDWEAMLWKAPFDRDVYAAAWEHWNEDLKATPSKLRKEAVKLARASEPEDEREALLEQIENTPEEGLPDIVELLKENQQ